VISVSGENEEDVMESSNAARPNGGLPKRQAGHVILLG